MGWSTLSLLLGIWTVLMMLCYFTLHFPPFFSEMGEAKYWILVVQCYSHFPNTFSLSLPASADCPGTNSSADGAARPSDRQLLAVCSLICDQTSLFLFLFPDPIFTQFLSYVNSTGKRWWDVNLGNTAGNLWSNRNSWCCGSSVFLADEYGGNYEWGNFPQLWLLFPAEMLHLPAVVLLYHSSTRA